MNYNDIAGVGAAQNMYGAQNAALGQQAMMNANAVQTPQTLGTHIERLSKRLSGLTEAIEQLRTKLEPVLVSQPPSANKEGLKDSCEGSPAMRVLEELMARVDYAHQMVNEIQRRAVV